MTNEDKPGEARNAASVPSGTEAPRLQRQSFSVAVVGGGLAGLSAARMLKRAGIEVTVYEGADRIGGRVQSVGDLLGPGLVTELGGEFIDSGHTDLLKLVHELKLPLIDTGAADELALVPSYYFGGMHFSEAQVINAFEPLAARMREDVDALSPVISAASHSPADARLDQLSIAEYLDHIGASGWLRDLLEVAYLTEFGLDADQQSCLNMLMLLSLDTTQGFGIFGASDERYKVLGGNEQVPRALAAELDDCIRMQHRLVAVREQGWRLQLDFECGSGGKRVEADFVVLAIPFTTLREVDIALDLPAQKREAIDTLGYGSGEKVVLGMSAAVWRRQGRDGNAFSDRAFQTGWDSGRQQGCGNAYTCFLGGSVGAYLAQLDAVATASRFVREADCMFPGMLDAYTQASVSTQWLVNPFSRGSYACYRPGQWTRIAGWEAAPVGKLFFAGEHCSAEYQGYMNGAVETGCKAARAIICKLSDA